MRAAWLYIHLVDHSSMGAPKVPDSIKATFRSVFKGKLILSGGYDARRAESDLAAGKCDLIAVGRPFLANPDLVARWKTGAAENAADMGTFYTPGAEGVYGLSGIGLMSSKIAALFCVRLNLNVCRGQPGGWLLFLLRQKK